MVTPDDHEGRDLELRRRLNECDAKLARYRALCENDSDITIAASWIAEIERERRDLERELGPKLTPCKLTENEVKVVVAQLRDIVAVLADADPLDKRAIYEDLGVKLTHHPDGRVYLGRGEFDPKYTRPMGRRTHSRLSVCPGQGCRGHSNTASVRTRLRSPRRASGSRRRASRGDPRGPDVPLPGQPRTTREPR